MHREVNKRLVLLCYYIHFVSILDTSTWCQKYSNMAQGLRRIDPLIFDEHIAENWSKSEKEWRIYCNAGLSDKTKKVQAYTLLNLAGPDAVEKSEAFTFAEEEDREDLSGGQSTQINYLSKSTDTYNTILLQ